MGDCESGTLGRSVVSWLMIVGLRADGSTRGVIIARILPQRLGVERRRFLGLSRNDPIHVRTGYQARPAPEGHD